MFELFLNTVTRKWYDKDGDPFGDGMPRGAYQSREDVKITLCRETPNAGAAGVDVSTWARDDSLASVSGVGAMLTIDSDRIHKLKGELSGEVSAGAVSTITATIENASNATVPESGTLRLFDETGDYEAIAYTDRSIVDGEATFTVSGSVSGSYAVGSVIDCDQSPYAQAYLDTLSSNLEQGELVFYLVIDSQRLRAEMDYSDIETLSIAGLELLIYRTADGASEPVTAYLCETYSVTGTLGSVGNEAQPPDATADKLAGLVDQLLAAGLDVEQQYDSSGNTQFRVRSVSAGGTWSSWITVQKGEQGEPGKSFSVDATGLMSERSQYDAEAAGFSFIATDEGNLYIKNSDSSGDWSDAIPFQGPAGADGDPGPANTLTIGTVTTGEPGTQAAASITGQSPNQVLNLTIPRGDKGESGSGTGSGDMLKSVYDTDNDGKVDAADQADSALNVGGKTAAQVADAVDNSHTHSNKTTLDKLGESGGKLTFDGAEVGGGTAGSVAWDNITGKPSTFPPSTHSHEISDVTGLQSALDGKGTVKSVNGVEPDSSGNVTIETGSGTVDLGSYTGAVNITATANATIRAGSSGNYSLTLGSSDHGLTIGAMPNSPTVDLSAYGSTGTVNLNGAKINVGGSSGSTSLTLKSSSVSVLSPTGTGNLTINVGSSGGVNITGGQIVFNGHSPNTAGGLPLIGDDGFLPSSIIPQTSSDTSGAVRRYPATVDAETGVVSVTDGTPVEDVRIGDEIVTPDGVYQKVKNQIITTGEPNGTKLAITGAEEPAAINGTYTLENNESSGFNRVWKHDSENYYVKYRVGFWLISADKSNSDSSFFHSKSTGQTDPWNLEYSIARPSYSGAINIENVGIETSVNNTIDLFEYASYPGDGVIDQKISAHNSALNAHPMQFSGETDFNNLTQGGSFYLSAGDSLQNAPATGTFFVIIKNWTSGDITRIFQQVYRLQPEGVHRLYTRHGNKAAGAAGITWSNWMMIGYNAFISTPNYGAGVNIVSSATSGSGYTCTSAGWIMCYTTQSGVTVTINGNTINNISNTRVFLPVASGDVFKVSTDTTWTSGEITFYSNR